MLPRYVEEAACRPPAAAVSCAATLPCRWPQPTSAENRRALAIRINSTLTSAIVHTRKTRKGVRSVDGSSSNGAHCTGSELVSVVLPPPPCPQHGMTSSGAHTFELGCVHFRFSDFSRPATGPAVVPRWRRSRCPGPGSRRLWHRTLRLPAPARDEIGDSVTSSGS